MKWNEAPSSWHKFPQSGIMVFRTNGAHLNKHARELVLVDQDHMSGHAYEKISQRDQKLGLPAQVETK